MNLDELQTAQSRERQTDSLQQLRESFYEDAGRFISQLREERSRAAERADDPFDAPEVRRLTDDIKTAERTVEAIYERRIGKLVKQASLEAAGMAADASGLTKEEQDVFETLVTTIEHNRYHVLDEVIAGEESAAPPASSPSTDDEPTATESTPADHPSEPAGDAPSGVDAADLMGAGDSAANTPTGTPTDVAPERAESSDDGPAIPPDTPLENEGADVAVDSEPAEHVPGEHADAQTDAGTETGDASTDGPVTVPPDDPPGGATRSGDEPSEETSAVERTTVRITRDVGEILGVDQRAYDLKSEDVVTLPTPNAEPLVDRDAAEKLD
ncbi:hypothetical protein [Halomarina rubra]|uniref:Gins51 C-terminal domain-containing protein n=1 Tax=Halomarina rubra TaxID=2071873 RepID=A0ABD6AZ86_9EURY|nr:hypothetical protein [Halomarina rubra]